MKCSMCENKNHLEPCHFCDDPTVVYCRVCIRKHYRKEHKGQKISQRALTVGDEIVKQKVLRYRCDKCKKYSKPGGKCPECGEIMKRVGK